MSKKPPKTRTISTAAALAERLQVNRSTVTRYLRRPDWPFRRTPPWPTGIVREIQVWRRRCLERVVGDDDPTFRAWAREEYPELYTPEAERKWADLLRDGDAALRETLTAGNPAGE